MTARSRLPDPLLAALEAGINRLLALDPEGAQRLAPLQGKVIALEFQGFGQRFYLVPGTASFQLFGAYEAPPDCLLRGTPLALARLGLSGRKEDALFSGQIEIEGESELASRLGEVFAGLDIDWEESLSRLTGDPIAHQIGSRWRHLNQWGRESANRLGVNLQDYLQEEGRVLPTRYEVEAFLAAVDRLRDDSERLAARVAHLSRRLDATASPP